MSLKQQEQWYGENLRLNDRVIVDVGANVGELSQFFWERCGKKGQVISVEPHPANIRALQRRIRKAGSKRWSLKRCAASSRRGHVTLRPFATADGDNARVVDTPLPNDLTVASAPLDELAPRAHVIKLDVEGHEYAILPAAVPALTQAEAWAVELHMVDGERLEATLELFADHGFSLVTAGHKRSDPSRWLSVAIEPTLTWSDVPGLPSTRDGLPHTFKMLHVLARRPAR